MSCSPSRCEPIWPSNTSNELLYNMQRLFSRDNHNHDQVLNEKTLNLPLMLPENRGKPPFNFVNATTGQVTYAPYSTDNVMHQEWQKYRLRTNVNPPHGSDSDIYFDQVPPAGQNTRYLDWLDSHDCNQDGKSIDQRVAQTCARSGAGQQVCSQTCVDWWTNRIVNPQGSLVSDQDISGGCPFGTVRAMTCYPCRVHNTYVRDAEMKK